MTKFHCIFRQLDRSLYFFCEKFISKSYDSTQSIFNLLSYA